VRTELYDAVREATRDEFDLAAELGGTDAWAVFLGQALDGGGLAVLLLQEAEDGGGQFDLEVMDAVEAGLPVGVTTCAACGAGEEGWPRFCALCGADLTGVQADAAVPGGSAGELLAEVRAAADGVYQVLGALPHAEGGGALYFARETASGRIVGLALQQDAGGELDLVVAWEPGEDAAHAASPAAGEAFTPAPPAVPGPAVALEREEPVSPPPLWNPPAARARSRGRERVRRAAGMAGVAAVGVALVAALVLVLRDPPLPPSTDSARTALGTATPPADVPADPGPDGDPGAAAEGGKKPVDPRPSPAAARTGVAKPASAAPEATPPRPSTSTAQPPAATAAAGDDPEAGPAAPTADGVEAAVRRYAQAVGSCQTSRITRAYPGITGAEVERWERFFRQNCGAGLRTEFVADGGASVDGTRAELLFTLAMAYTDPAGRAVQQPLPMRALLEWREGAWSLREVRSLAGR
jgi:hypothetical protein